MIERCKECIHLKENTVYPLSSKKYCSKWYIEVEPNMLACDYASNYIKDSESNESEPKIKKKLFDYTIQEISEMCTKHDNYCKDEEGNFCPLMATNDPFNECMLIWMAKTPGDWNKFKDKEI